MLRSNQVLRNYSLLINFFYSTTENQSKCLNDLPPVMSEYDYLADQKAPGEKFKAFDQCKKAFGNSFSPHLQEESPFEVRLHLSNSP